MSNANKTYISLETSKLLKDCKISVKEFFWHSETGVIEVVKVSDPKFNTLTYLKAKLYPAYTWQEILWEYPTEFFGVITEEERKKWDNKYITCLSTEEVFRNPYRLEEKNAPIDYHYLICPECQYKSINFDRQYHICIKHILILLQQQKYDEADLYFRKNCILLI